MHLFLPVLLSALLLYDCLALPQIQQTSNTGPPLDASALNAYDLNPPQPAKPQSKTGFGRPLYPDKAPDITVESEYVLFPIPVLPGQLLHHFFYIVTHFWRSQDNIRIATPRSFQISAFPRLKTTLIPKGGSAQDPTVNQIKAAWAFDRAIIDILTYQAWKVPKYKILEEKFEIGRIECVYSGLEGAGWKEITEPQNATAKEGEALDRTDVIPEVTFSYVRVQTRYTDQHLTPQLVMFLYWQLFRFVWEFVDDHPVLDGFEPGEVKVFAMPSGYGVLHFQMLQPGTPIDRFLWTELLDGILKIIEVPARDDRWDGLEAVIYRKEIRMARLFIQGSMGQDSGAASGASEITSM